MARQDALTRQRRQTEDLAREHLDAADADYYLGLLRPAVRLEHSELDVGGSHLGGSPTLGKGDEWPTWNGQPLSFVMALDLADLADLRTDLDLPGSGVVNFFYEAAEQQAWGFDPAHAGGWRVLLNDGQGERVQAPDGAATFAEIWLRSVQTLTAPGWEEPVVRRIWERNRDGLWAIDEVRREGGWPDAPRHQVGGWPILEQNPIWPECQLASNGLYVGDPSGYQDPRAKQLAPGAENWQLLLQLETDEAAGWMWGDVGSLYYAIRRQDLADRSFDRTWMILQCG